MQSRRKAVLGLAAAAALPGCVSIGSSEGAAAHVNLGLHDRAAAPPRRAQPLVDALLIQPLPGDALADTASIAYARQAHEYAFYQLASWTDRPVRQLPRLLQRRLEARGVAGAVGLLGEPLRADWVLTLGIDTLYHDVATPPGVARLALSAALFDRRDRSQASRREFRADVPTASADSAAAAAAMSEAVTLCFDQLTAWLEQVLQGVLAR